MKNFNEELRISRELSDEELDGVNGGVCIADLPMKSLKNHLKSLAQKEENPAVRKLLEQDMQHLDHIQAITATAREFLLIVRIRGLKDKEIFSYLNRIEKTLNKTASPQDDIAARI